MAERFQGVHDLTFEGTTQGETAPCPCSRCHCMSYRRQSEVRRHLFFRGFDESFIQGEASDEDFDHEGLDSQGVTGDSASIKDLVRTLIKGAVNGDIVSSNNEEPNDRAKNFFKLLKEAQEELYPGCKEATKISFIVRTALLYCSLASSSSSLASFLNISN